MTVSPAPVNSESVRPFALQSDQMNQRYLQFPCRIFMRMHLGMLEMNLDLVTEPKEDDSDSGCGSLPRKHSRTCGAE